MHKSLWAHPFLAFAGLLPLASMPLGCGEQPKVSHGRGVVCNEDSTMGAAGAKDAGFSANPNRDEPVGWASVSALDLETTSGGHGGELVDVTSWPQLLTALAGSTPRVVRMSGRITGKVVVGSNKTLEGVDGALLQGSLRIERAQNVIVRDLTIKGYNCTDNSECSHGDDAVEVRESHHVWFDHVDISDGSDGNLDITQGSDYVTVSWSKFWYSGTDRGHRFSTLIGSADGNEFDEGKLKVTFHHNWWDKNADQRMPRTRYGLIHVFDNLYTAEGNSYCTSAGWDAKLLVEDNYFRGVNSPHTVRERGNLLARGNVYDDVEGELQQTGEAFDPPYDYELDDTPCNLPELVEREAGPR